MGGYASAVGEICMIFEGRKKEECKKTNDLFFLAGNESSVDLNFSMIR